MFIVNSIKKPVLQIRNAFIEKKALRYASYLIAPDQNRTDTRSLEGYCSTIELQAHRMSNIIHDPFFLCNREFSKPA